MVFDDTVGYKCSLMSPLLPEESQLVLPPTPPPQYNRGYFAWWFYLPEDGGRDGITFVRLIRAGQKVTPEVYVLGPDGWGVLATTAVTEIELQYPTLGLKNKLYLYHGKIFVRSPLGTPSG
jgi:hypothetical protein